MRCLHFLSSLFFGNVRSYWRWQSATGGEFPVYQSTSLLAVLYSSKGHDEENALLDDHVAAAWHTYDQPGPLVDGTG